MHILHRSVCENVNSYGKGNEDGKTFADILDEASKIKEFSRIRFMSSHPKDLSDRVIDIMADRPNVEKHLHLALQSGSDDVLKRMNRPYTAEGYMKIADYFRSRVEGGSLTTDIIVGYVQERLLTLRLLSSTRSGPARRLLSSLTRSLPML